MKKLGVLLNRIENFVLFFLGYCMHSGAFLSLISPKLEAMEIMLQNKQEDIAIIRILKRRTDKRLDDFLTIIYSYQGGKVV